MKKTIIFSVLFAVSLSCYGHPSDGSTSLVEASVTLTEECTGSLRDDEVLESKLHYEAQKLCEDELAKLAVVRPMKETYVCDNKEYAGSARFTCIQVF